MTPQEKAKELYNKFYYRLPSKMENIDKILYSKQFSIIVVGELLSETEEIDGMRVINNPYWLQVRNEIEKL